MIADVDHGPVLLSSKPGSSTLDLSTATLRSVSPLHIEYLRNMKVRATLTISIIIEGRLWGLIACHQYSSAYALSNEVRLACEIIGRAMSAEIELRSVRESQARRQFALDLKQINSDEPLVSLFSASNLILDFMKPDASGAAAFYDGKWFLSGETPTREQLNKIMVWLESKNLKSASFMTDSLATEFPEAKIFIDQACGMLCILINKNSTEYILWFKKEVVKTIKWAGNPDKAATVTDGKIGPRKSFADYLEKIHLHSLPWSINQQEQALQLRTHIIDVELQKHYQNEIVARKLAEQLIVELNAKAAELEDQRIKGVYAAKMASLGEIASGVAHEVNNPLAIITSICLRIKQQMNESSIEPAEMKSFVEQIHETSLRISKIINSLNFFLGNDAISHIEVVPISKILKEVESVSVEKLNIVGCDLLLNMQRDFEIKCRPVNIAQLLMILLNNSVDAIRDLPSPWIKIDVVEAGPNLQVRFMDSGKGIPKELHSRMMDPFVTTKPGGKGAGLGLSMARKIVEEHSGKISFDASSENTCFIIELPALV
jgi:chemotaxis family two-component system sensor kinase Cph1